jgi:hypothetical protein
MASMSSRRNRWSAISAGGGSVVAPLRLWVGLQKREVVQLLQQDVHLLDELGLRLKALSLG